jgi:hypothetical protein
MVSSYIAKSEATVAAYQDATRRFARREIETLLDLIWLMIDTHGPRDPNNRLSDDYLEGHRQACVELTALIEGLGGMYPGSRKIEREAKK